VTKEVGKGKEGGERKMSHLSPKKKQFTGDGIRRGVDTFESLCSAISANNSREEGRKVTQYGQK